MPTCSTPTSSLPASIGTPSSEQIPFAAQHGADHVGVLDLLDDDRLSVPRDPSGEALADGESEALANLFLQALAAVATSC